MIRLESAKRNEAGDLEAHYVGKHSTPGREGTTYTFDLKLTVRGNGVKASIDLGELVLDSGTPEEAIQKFSSWCERASIAMRDSKFSKLVPVE